MQINLLYNRMAKKKSAVTEPMLQEGNLQEIIIQSLIEKKGEDIICVNLKKINHVFFDYFIICTGNSKPHVETLCDYVREMTHRNIQTTPTFVEGVENAEWVLLDYFNVIVHIFQPEARTYYNLEKLWSDAEIQHY